MASTKKKADLTKPWNNTPMIRGGEKKYKTPRLLWQSCVKYFEWADGNPIYEAEHFAYQGSVQLEWKPKLRAMTLTALSCFLGIRKATWQSYAKMPEFKLTCETVDSIIYSQKFEGAAAGLLSASLIGTEIGIFGSDPNKNTPKEITIKYYEEDDAL